MAWAKTIARWDEKYLNFEIWCDLYYRFDSNSIMIYDSVVNQELRYNKFESLVLSITRLCVTWLIELTIVCIDNLFLYALA